MLPFPGCCCGSYPPSARLPPAPAAASCAALPCRVYLCARVWENPLTGEVLDVSTSGSSASGSRIVKAANVVELHADGCATLADGTRLPGVDTVMYCTGYDYSFPFLPQGQGSASRGSGCSSGDVCVSVQDNRVGPLYQHVFPPAAAPTLSFVGLPWKVVPFPQFELQARWIARVLAGAAQLPPREVRCQDSVGSGDASVVAEWWCKLLWWCKFTPAQPCHAAPT